MSDSERTSSGELLERPLTDVTVRGASLIIRLSAIEKGLTIGEALERLDRCAEELEAEGNLESAELARRVRDRLDRTGLYGVKGSPRRGTS